MSYLNRGYIQKVTDHVVHAFHLISFLIVSLITRENLGLFVKEKACFESRKVKVLEIGVWRGDFAHAILDRYCNIIEEYVMKSLKRRN